MNGIRVRALTTLTNLEDGRVYRAGEEFVLYRAPMDVRDLMRMALVEILDGEESPAVVVRLED
jgi:hypothetical protein